MEKGFIQILEDINSGVIPKTKSIHHVNYYLIEKTPYSFHFYAVYKYKSGKDVLIEMLYDLRNRKYFIKKNGHERVFTIANLDIVVPRPKDCAYSYNSDTFYSKASASEFFDMVEVEENKGMYKAMMDAIGALGEERTDMTSRALIRLMHSYNKLELIYKAGITMGIVSNDTLRRMVQDASESNITKIHEIFGLTKAQYKFILEHSHPNRDVGGFRECIDSAKHLDQRDMNTYRGYTNIILELEKKYLLDNRLRAFRNDYQGGKLDKFIEAVKRKKTGGTQSNDFFGFILEYNFSNVPKLLEYLLFECYLSQGIEYREAFQNYKDYYSMCIDLEYQRFDKYPKYLKTYHDIVARNYKFVEDAATNKKFAEKISQHKHLEADLRDFVVRLPNETKDLVYEGNVLQHCVGSYCKKVVEGKTLIAFLRQKAEPDTPLVTMEIREGKIVQVRGQANRYPTVEERGAVQRYAKRFSLGTAF